MFYFSQKYRGIDAVFAQQQPTKNLECLYNSRMGRNTTDTFCTTNGFPAGPTYQDVPHAMPDKGGVGLAPANLMVNFLDNHDLPRFLFEKSDASVLRSALMYLFTWDGIPCMYYGTEQLFAGGVDPKNREDMFAGNPAQGFGAFATDHETFQLVQGLIAMRKDNEALRHGTVSPVWSTEVAGPRRDAGIFAFERSTPQQTALVVLNTGETDSETCAPTTEGGACLLTSFPGGTTLTDIMSTLTAPGSAETFTVRPDGTLLMTVAAHSGRVLIRK
jgi:glycosidase